MGNTSKKHRNKKLTRIGLVVLVVIIIGSFIVSQSDKKIDPSTFQDIETFAIEPRIKGNLEAELTLVEYSDFQCPACGQAYPAVKQLVEDAGEQFSVEYRHFPLRSLHPNAQLAAQAAEAAGIQGKFWEMHDMLFDNQPQWSQSVNPKKSFVGYAKEIGLNTDRFEYDLKSDEVKAEVNKEAQEASDLKLPGTPAFLLNGEALTLQEFLGELDLTALVEEETESVE